MDRLFTFGCSFTNWNWPTWADILSKEFSYYSNWGYAGLGNRAIAERVAEANTVYNFDENDLVVVQWTSHIRNDYARTDRKDPTGGMWQTRGAVISPANLSVYDNSWFERFWDEKAYYLHTLNNISLTQGFLNGTGCQWYMTSATDLTEIEFSSESTAPDRDRKSVWQLDPSMLPYRKTIWEDYQEHWLPPLAEEKWNTPDLDWLFVKDLSDQQRSYVPDSQFRNGMWVEPHLTPRQHANYLEKIYNRIGIDVPKSKEITELVDYFNNMYNDSGKNWDSFMKTLCADEWAITKIYQGR